MDQMKRELDDAVRAIGLPTDERPGSLREDEPSGEVRPRPGREELHTQPPRTSPMCPLEAVAHCGLNRTKVSATVIIARYRRRDLRRVVARAGFDEHVHTVGPGQ